MKKHLVITGGSKGIGKATAELFSQQGFAIINLSRSPIELSDAAQITLDFNHPDWPQQAQAQLPALVADCEQLVLIHCAGFLAKGGVQTICPKQLRQSLEINTVAPAILNTLMLPYMPRGSSILYVGSTLSEKAVAQTAAYVIAKYALVGLMRSTCQDLAGSGIHTACVCPGFTETQMLIEHVGGKKNLKGLENLVTQQRLIQPEEIANTLFFCSQNSVFNGAVIHANLGQKEL